MPRITRSQAKANPKSLTGDGELTIQKGETAESASEFEPEPNDLSLASAGKQSTKKSKTEQSRNADARGTNPLSHSQLITLAPGVTKSIARQNYALPHPSNSHRHRGIPAYLPLELQTPRLLNKPSPFFNHQTTWTNSAANTDVLRRISRALSTNIGEGPIWELLEDRSWYKGCITGQNRIEAAPYLPISFLSNSTALQCFIGPFNSQVKQTFAPLQSLPMTDLFVGKKSHLFYAGGPVWAIDWCPMLPDDTHRKKQYLAVGPLPSVAHSLTFGKPASRPSPACIQIWSLSPSTANPSAEDAGVLTCPMVICVDNGSALDLKWCPLPVNDGQLYHPSSEASSQKLGVLAGVFEDGSVSLYVVPNPDFVNKKQQELEPLFLKLDLRLKLELPSHLAIFQVKEALEDPSSRVLYPTHYVSIHQSAVRSIAWAKVPPRSPSGLPRTDGDPTVILSGGYDGVVMATDIRDLRGNIVYRTRATNTFEKSVGTSEFHPHLAVGSADGTCRITNIMKSTRKGGLVEFVERSVAARPATKKHTPEALSSVSISTGAWSPAVSVTKVVWNSSAGIARSPWLASATASGLCRLDWLLGRFAHDRFPYIDIQRLRGEIEVDEMDDELEGDEDEDDQDG
ncbi:hypothetical protein Clacol_006534 [Clathrus columnatus]|uniref:Uncharacterized protein n=1 Tax=Clathrus columnatus TaxID=1419009 RepID=A0AAV5AGN7_9AGAM|nr:hypothetical protein Clacol_006534 [Clathrus columnatus]